MLGKIYTVGEILDQLNQFFAEMGQVTIKGEVSSIQPHPSGIYLTLKDQDSESILQCYIHPRTYAQQGIVLQEGFEITATGQINIYKQKGRIALLINTYELAGEGTFKKAYEQLKNKLEQEGLFTRKRILPELPRRIAVISSRSGAVINDFQKNIIQMGLEISLYDARVEGTRAIEEILQGITYFNKYSQNFDLLVIMRGGGSLEDLQAFNHESVARAIFGSVLPTLVAIGHERDVPIAQMVSDQAVSTPTAAAIAINQTWLKAQQFTEERIQTILHSSKYFIEKISENLDFHQQSIKHNFQALIEKTKQSIDLTARYLLGIHPKHIFEKGFSIATDSKGKVIYSVKQINKGETIGQRFADGHISTRVENVFNETIKTKTKHTARRT